MFKNKEFIKKIIWIMLFTIVPIVIGASFPMFTSESFKIDNQRLIYAIPILLGLPFLIINDKKNKDKRNIDDIINIFINYIIIISMILYIPAILNIFLIVLIFRVILNKNYLLIYFISFCIALLGLLFRYFVEYGEISNVINFTIKNILLTLLILPVLVISILILLEKLSKYQKSKKIIL